MAEDYSNVKAPNQVGLPTFWNSVEPYLREIREDDLAMLGFKVSIIASLRRASSLGETTREHKPCRLIRTRRFS